MQPDLTNMFQRSKGFLKVIPMEGLKVKGDKDCTSELMQIAKYSACSNSERDEGE